MGVKCNLRSSSLKIMEPPTPKMNMPLLGGEKNPSTNEQWIIPPFFKENQFYKSFDWESISCFADPLYIACGELDDLLTMDLDLKHIHRLGTCRGDLLRPRCSFQISHLYFQRLEELVLKGADASSLYGYPAKGTSCAHCVCVL